VEVCTSPDTILSNATIKALIGSKCDGVIGQLTEASAPLGEGRAPALLLLAPAAATAGCTCQPSRPRLAAPANPAGHGLLHQLHTMRDCLAPHGLG
jgi:hypothetical protein